MMQLALKYAAVFFINVYQKTLSPDSGILKYGGFFSGRVCRFEPTCSEYTKKSVLTHGVLEGVFLGLRQVLRCHPGDRSHL